MKKIDFKLILMLLALLPALTFTSCNEDEGDDGGDTDSFMPVLDTNFSYVVDGNNVNFTTTLNGNVWVTVDGDETHFADKAATVFLPSMGTYSFTCTSTGGGEPLVSAPFDVVIDQDDKSFLDLPEWQNLTDGASKTWVLDAEAKFHDGPLSFYLLSWDFVNEVYTDPEESWYWTPEPQWTWDNAMGQPGDEGFGEMTFDVTDGFDFIADKTKEEDEEGTFVFDYETRSLTINGASIVRSYKPEAQVKVDPNCTENCELKEGTFNGIEGISDWTNYKIFNLSDSVLSLAVKRDQDIQGEGDIYLIYNFVEKEVYDNTVIVIEEVEVTWPDAPAAVTTNDATESAKLDGAWKAKDAPNFNAWYPGFWNFATGVNDAPDTYVGTNQESNVYWDPFVPGDGDGWAAPSDSLVALTMAFDAANLTFSITKENQEVVSSGTFATDGSSITTDGGTLINPSGNVAHAPNTAVISVLPDAPAAGDEIKIAFYQCDNNCGKNEWIELTFVKQ